jgi:hypothetical protein
MTNDAPETAHCPDCGDELDEFGPCACLLLYKPQRQGVGQRTKPAHGGGKAPPFKTTMRTLVEQKLKRQGKR